MEAGKEKLFKSKYFCTLVKVLNLDKGIFQPPSSPYHLPYL